MFNKKVLVLSLLWAFCLMPLLSSSLNVKGLNGLFSITYPYSLAPKTFGFGFGVDNIDLKTADVDINKFYFGFGWGVIDNLEINANLSYNRVHMLEPSKVNTEYPYAERWQTGLGHASLGIKYNFLKNEKTGFGILGYVGLPLSEKKDGLSTAKTTFGMDMLFAHKLTPQTIFGLNGGIQLYGSEGGIEFGNSFNYAAGVETGIAKSLSFATQLAGKIYSGSDFKQDNPLDLIVGLKFHPNEQLAISVAYKKNILFTSKGLPDTHGAIGSITYATEKQKPVLPPCTSIETVTISGEDSAFKEDTTSYQATIMPATATTPVTYTWECSANGQIASGQGSPTISVKWLQLADDSWIKVITSNSCSNVENTKKVKLSERILPPKEEFFFAFDSAELNDIIIQDLDKAVEYYKHHPETIIELQGHTCSIATDEYNMALGEHRVEAIKKYLVDKGISPDKIKTISYGEEKPAYDNSIEETRKKNRRVYIPLNK